MTTAAMVGGFMIIPNLPTHLQRNLGFPRDDMWQLYLAGGVVSWVLSRFVVGRVIDRHGSFSASMVAAAVLIPIVYVGFGGGAPPMSLLGVYMIFFFGMAFRNVSFQTLATKVPEPHERARFQSIQSAVNHLGTSLGAVLSSRMLHDTPDGRVEGMHAVALVFIAMHVLFPALVWLVEREVRALRPAGAVVVRAA
jgi:predicted MFS family arabinose efflux permease